MLYIVLYIIRHSLLIHSSLNGYMGSFHLLTIVDAAMNMGVQMSLFRPVLLGVDPEAELLVHMVILCFIF